MAKCAMWPFNRGQVEPLIDPSEAIDGSFVCSGDLAPRFLSLCSVLRACFRC